MESAITASFWVREWQFVTLAVLAAVVLLYANGVRRTAVVPLRQKVSFYLAVLVSALVLASPLHQLGTLLFSARVAQHILLMALIPCLFTFSDPVPVLLTGMPSRLKRQLAPFWQHAKTRGVRHLFTAASAPGIAFMLATVSFWIWYDPQIHQLTIEYAWLHTFETTWLLFVALLYWWHIMDAHPRLHRPLPPLIRVMYTIIGTWPIKIVGLILMVSSQTVYQYPQTFQVGNLNINDQGVGAIIVWSLGGIVFSSTATLLMRDWLKGEDDKPVDPSPPWQTDQGMRAPGFPRA